MEHIEQAGVHSGDSACSPAAAFARQPTSSASCAGRRSSSRTALEGRRADERPVRDPDATSIYVLEVNPRASRTVPFVGKATGVSAAPRSRRAAWSARSLAEQGVTREVVPRLFLGEGSGVPVRQVSRRRHHPRPGDEVDRRGDGRGRDFRRGVRQIAASPRARSCPKTGTRVHQRARRRQARGRCRSRATCIELGFELLATRGTADGARRARHRRDRGQQGRGRAAAHRRHDQERRDQPHRQHGRGNAHRAVSDSRSIRVTALSQRVTYYTTIAGARAACNGMRALKRCGRTICRSCTRNCAKIRDGQDPITTRGVGLMRAELQRLKGVERPAITGDRRCALARRPFGERGIRGGARAQGFIEGRISDLEAKLGNAQIIDPKLHDADGRVRVRRDGRPRRQVGEAPTVTLADRRRRRSRHQVRQDLDQLADRALADRQVRGRRGRGADAGRGQALRDPRREVR